MLQYWLSRLYITPPKDLSDNDLSDGVIELRLRRCAIGSPYVGGLPCYFFDIIELASGRDVGSCDLRVGWREEIAYAGHIGYRIVPSARGHHYARHATALLLALAYHLDLEEVLITCDPDNIPSRKTLEALGGDFRGIVTIPKNTPAYHNGDREKCQFFYQSADWQHLIPAPEDLCE